jgi:hypothetical protein
MHFSFFPVKIGQVFYGFTKPAVGHRTVTNDSKSCLPTCLLSDSDEHKMR